MLALNQLEIPLSATKGKPPSVWWIDCDAVGTEFSGILTCSEKKRRNEYLYERDRRRFVIRHTALRLLLADRLGLAPAAIRIGNTDKGKPFLVESPSLHFSISQSGPLAVIAISECPLGADIERVDFTFPIADVITSVMTERERSQIDKTPAGFFQVWTAKEAILKAAGTGLSTPMTQIEISDRDGGLRIQSLPDDFIKKGNWTLASLPLMTSYVLALAWILPVEGIVTSEVI